MTQIEAFGQFRPFSVGFDSIFDTLQRVSVPQTNYPPYNIVKKGESYFVELAVAGFKKDELKINLKDNYLTIEGESNSKNSNGEYLHKNIARRSFIKRFSLADNVEVEDATFEDGVLAVSLKHNIPEEQKPKEIAIH